MSNYVRTADFAGKDALVSGNAAKAVKGVELGIEFDAIAAMSATKLDASAAATPSGSVGLSAVAGTAGTYMRSDGAPALSQAITPVWTGSHNFTVAGPTVAKNDLAAWQIRNTAGTIVGMLGTVNAYFGGGDNVTDTALGAIANLNLYVASLSRTSAAFTQSAITFGNTTDAPTYGFLGTGTATFGGNVLAGIGLVNAPGIGFAAEATGLYRAAGGTLGLTAGGVSAGTFTSALAALPGNLTFKDESSAVQDAGFRGLSQNVQAANYTTVMADRGKSVSHSSASPHTFTIDSNANVAYPLGTTLTFVNGLGGGALTIAVTSDTLVWSGSGSTGSRTLAATGMATAYKNGATQWIISGTGLT